MRRRKSFRKSALLSEFPAFEVAESEGPESITNQGERRQNSKPDASKTTFLQSDHESITYDEGCSIYIAEGATTSSNDSEGLEEETSEGYIDSNHSLNESEMKEEIDENETISKISLGVQAKTGDIVDRSDENYIQLRTDAFSLELSKLPLISSILPDSESEDEIETESNSLSTIHSVDVIDPIEPALSDHKPPAVKIKAPKTYINFETKVKRERRKSLKVDEHMQGNFVNPLTGSFLHEIVEEESSAEEDIYLEENFLDMSNLDSEEIALETDTTGIEDLDIQEKRKTMVHEENESNFLDLLRENELVENVESVVEVNDLESLARNAIIMDKVTQFLNDMISQVVTLVEQEEESHFLRRNLNKKGLFEEIQAAINAYTAAEFYRSFLEQTVVKYFRRRNLYCYITPEKTDPDFRYVQVCEWLDKLLGDETCISEKIDLREKELQKQKTVLEQMNKMDKANFEELVKNTFKRDGMPHLAEFVQKELRRIQTLNDEISAVRETLIKHQHTLGTVKSRIAFHEHRGGDFSVADYENLIRGNFYLEKKIEERNGELNRASNWLRRNLHILAHTTLHNELLGSENISKTKKLELYSSIDLNSRKNIVKLKMERSLIQRKINEISLMSGLEDKPILLRDYDETVERIEQTKKDVDELKQHQQKLEQKISHLGTLRVTK